MTQNNLPATSSGAAEKGPVCSHWLAQIVESHTKSVPFQMPSVT